MLAAIHTHSLLFTTHYKEVVKEFRMGRFFTEDNVTLTIRQHCSRLQQWRCDAVIED